MTALAEEQLADLRRYVMPLEWASARTLRGHDHFAGVYTIRGDERCVVEYAEKVIGFDLTLEAAKAAAQADHADRILSAVPDLLDEVVRLREDKKGLQDQIGRLLREIDNLDKLRGDTLTMTCGDEVVEYPLAGTMHLHGQTPDWYVEAAFWSCYGHSPRAALTTEKNDG